LSCQELPKDDQKDCLEIINPFTNTVNSKR